MPALDTGATRIGSLIVVLLCCAHIALASGSKDVATTRAVKDPPQEQHREAEKIIYLLDASEGAEGTFDDLRNQMNRSVSNLKFPQSIQIILSSDDGVTAMDENFLTVTPETKRKAANFMKAAKAKGKGDLAAALQKALDAQPELIYFMIQASADIKGLPEMVEKFDPKHKVKIHALVIVKKPNDQARKLGEAIEKMVTPGGGLYRTVSEEELKR